ERPSKVFVEDLGRPVSPGSSVSDWLASLPKQLAGNELRRLCDEWCRAHNEARTIVAAVGGQVIQTGGGPYLGGWIKQGLLTAVALNGSAAIHDFELALAGKTSEDVAAQLPTGQFGMARETADAFALAGRAGAENEAGLGWALGHHMDQLDCPHAD